MANEHKGLMFLGEWRNIRSVMFLGEPRNIRFFLKKTFAYFVSPNTHHEFTLTLEIEGGIED
jgi:hypothetical protein